MSAALQRTDELIEEGRVLLDASKRLEELWHALRVARCLTHNRPVTDLDRFGVITFFCGCRRRPT